MASVLTWAALVLTLAASRYQYTAKWCFQLHTLGVEVGGAEEVLGALGGYNVVMTVVRVVVVELVVTVAVLVAVPDLSKLLQNNSASEV